MDQVDLAELLATEQLESAIAAARGIRLLTKVNTASLKKCIECNDHIPVKRRRVIKGCVRCVECEGVYEKHNLMNKKVLIDHGSMDAMIDDILLASL